MTDIVVVDDELLVRTTLARILTNAGFGVHLASGGDEAIKLCHETKPALVIMDIIMPRVEGIETIRKLRATEPYLAILAISGGGRIGKRDLLHLASGVGATDTLAKPFDEKQLLTKVRRCLELRVTQPPENQD